MYLAGTSRSIQSFTSLHISNIKMQTTQRWVSFLVYGKCVPLLLIVEIIARNVSVDVRNYGAHRIRSMSIRALMQHLYPRLLALHDLEEDFALPHQATGRISLPAIMRDSHIYMEANGIYIIGPSI